MDTGTGKSRRFLLLLLLHYYLIFKNNNCDLSVTNRELLSPTGALTLVCP